jgi:hypothetical protein
LLELLGFGSDGIVRATDRQSAVKVHGRAASYHHERDAYLRLRAKNVNEVLGFAIPTIIEFDDDLWIVELEIVKPPFVLDFGKSYLDEVPEFPEETLAEVEAENRDRFGKRWPEVRRILRKLESYGVFHVDVSPNNIRFANDE